jgi:hypothetical protein
MGAVEYLQFLFKEGGTVGGVIGIILSTCGIIWFIYKQHLDVVSEITQNYEKKMNEDRKRITVLENKIDDLEKINNHLQVEYDKLNNMLRLYLGETKMKKLNQEYAEE